MNGDSHGVAFPFTDRFDPGVSNATKTSRKNGTPLFYVPYYKRRAAGDTMRS